MSGLKLLDREHQKNLKKVLTDVPTGPLRSSTSISINEL